MFISMFPPIPLMQVSDELARIVDLSMPFPARVIRAYARLPMVFTSGDLAREAGIPQPTAKFYVKRMLELHMISNLPNRKKYQKYANAKTFSQWLSDLMRLAIKPIELQ